MPSVAELLATPTGSVSYGEIVSTQSSLYKVKVGTNIIYASSAIKDTLNIGTFVVLGKSEGMYFIIGLGKTLDRAPTQIKIRG